MDTTKTMTLNPHLTCRSAAEAYAFYQKAFGAAPMGVLPLPDGRLVHAALDFGGTRLYLVDEFPERGSHGPEALGGTPVTLNLQVSDCDALFEQAVTAGCTVLMPLGDMFWGDRYGIVRDPYGHQWSIATALREVSPEEMQNALAAM